MAGSGLTAWTALEPRPPGFDGEGFARALEGKLREAEGGVRTRVATLAELPRLATAVATDAATVRDLTQDELAFRPHGGETIAIAQLSKTAGAEPVLLLLAPDQGVAPELAAGGPRLRIVDGALVATDAVTVTPRERADQVEGLVAVSWSVELGPLSERLTAGGAQAELSVEGGRLPLGAATRQPGTHGREWRLTDSARASDEGAAPRVTVWATEPPDRSLRWAVAGSLGLLALLLWDRRRSAADARVSSLAAGNGLTTPPLWAPGSGRVSPSTPADLPATVGSGVTPTSVGAVSGPTRPRRGAALSPLGVPLPALGRIGRYELLRTIGTGGMATVHLARATGEAGFTKLVALKVLMPEFASVPQVVAYFLDEARLAAQLDHPNIVQTVDLGRSGDNYFIAMEYIDGTDLLRVISLCQWLGRSVPLSVALAILRGVCNGLQAAHDACRPDGQPLGLVHRDVKSANVFVARTGAVKIGDFGIAKADHVGWVRHTESGLVKGTPGYMAPEQRLGLAIDARADLYSVGAIAYELLSGQPINLDLARLAALGREGWPHLPPLASLRPDVPPELEAIILRALSYERDERFPDCAALETALEEVALAHPPLASDKLVARWIEDLLGSEPGFVASATPAPVLLPSSDAPA